MILLHSVLYVLVIEDDTMAGFNPVLTCGFKRMLNCWFLYIYKQCLEGSLKKKFVQIFYHFKPLWVSSRFSVWKPLGSSMSRALSSFISYHYSICCIYLQYYFFILILNDKEMFGAVLCWDKCVASVSLRGVWNFKSDLVDISDAT